MTKNKSHQNDLYQEDLKVLLYIASSVLILLLSIFNLGSIKKKEVKVLGAKVDNTFWQEFVAKHPTYIDGWLELGRIDKVKEIDPNYFKN